VQKFAIQSVDKMRDH